MSKRYLGPTNHDHLRKDIEWEEEASAPSPPPVKDLGWDGICENDWDDLSRFQIILKGVGWFGPRAQGPRVPGPKDQGPRDRGHGKPGNQQVCARETRKRTHFEYNFKLNDTFHFLQSGSK